MKIKDTEMKENYELNGRVISRGKYAKAYREGHSVRVFDDGKLVADTYFAAIDSDVMAHFPDSISVNKALRSLIPSSK